MNSKPRLSFWRQKNTVPDYPTLTDTVDTEVAIIGAGITGLTAAYLLAQAGKKVAVVDMAHVGAGETGNTTAHVTALTDAGTTTLIDNFGEDAAKQMLTAQTHAIDIMGHIADMVPGGCDWRRVPLYIYGHNEGAIDGVNQEREALRRLGVATEGLPGAPLPFKTYGALKMPDQAQLDGLAYLHGLARLVVKSGGRIYHHSRVVDVQDGEPCTVRTAHGQLRAGHVIMACSAPLGRFELQTRLYASRTYAMAIETPAQVPEGLFFDTCEPYHYVRMHYSGTTPALIVGGCDHKTGSDTHTENKYAELEDYAREHFGIGATVAQWSGQIIDTPDGLPFVGPYGVGERVLVGTGFSGNGLALGTLAAQVLTDIVQQRTNPLSALLTPQRFKPRASAKRFVQENLDVSKHMVADRIRAFVNHEDIAPGDGAIVREGLKPVAVFRDAHGVAHKLSPVCPHLGCYVAWNKAEKTWDCPCHGSRFSPHGQVLNGPSVEDMHKV